MAKVTPARKRWPTPKTERQRDQRQRSRERQAAQELRRRLDRQDLVPVREDEGVYRS